mmetsp:Transcript_3061/g.5645  ORF Transcript_3061/g.5645 Transcript_3061/m.5645 type:complete len:166 (-) Transcript_3061:336-833(-)
MSEHKRIYFGVVPIVVLLCFGQVQSFMFSHRALQTLRWDVRMGKEERSIRFQTLMTNNADGYPMENPDTSKTNSNTTSKVPVTPCVRICRYNAGFYNGAVCIGCFREAYEIQTWESSTPQERVYTLEDALGRYDDIEEPLLFPGSISRKELVRQLQLQKELSSRN